VSDLLIRAHAATHPGSVREKNEDTCDISEGHGFFAVYDGMGGHNAGEVASRTAADVIRKHLEKSSRKAPEDLLCSALDAASGAIYLEARRNRELHGMGTTAVACMVSEDLRATIAHSGDSRAYLVREGKLRQLTRDHTVVSELVARGALSPQEAVHHPYKSVLSRNLGGKPRAGADVTTVELTAGDRLLLCSDGLTGFAAIDAIEHVVSGAEDPQSAVEDLIELALRGGGGDNVTAVVIEVGEPVLPEATLVVRTSGASGWWSGREHFLAEAERLGVARSPICSHLPQSEALELVAASLHEALYFDLEQTTGIHVWTFAESLATGWFDRGGGYSHLRDLFEALRAAALAVIGELGTGSLQSEQGAMSESYVVLLESAVQRALVVAEMAMARVVAERIRQLEAELAARRRPATVAAIEVTDQRTIPFLDERHEPPPPHIASMLEDAHRLASAQIERAAARPQTRDCLDLASDSAIEHGGDKDMMPPARELVGSRELSEAGFRPLIESLEQARMLHLDALSSADADPGLLAAAARRVVRAHHALAMAVAFVTVESTTPVSEELKAAAEETTRLRTLVDRGERRIAQLERRVTGERTGQTGGSK
jgi:protein phosphatase